MATSDILNFAPSQEGSGLFSSLPKKSGETQGPGGNPDSFSAFLSGDRLAAGSGPLDRKSNALQEAPSPNGKGLAATSKGDSLSAEVSTQSSAQLSDTPLTATALTLQSDIESTISSSAPDQTLPGDFEYVDVSFVDPDTPFPGLRGLQIASANASPSDTSRISRELGEGTDTALEDASPGGPSVQGVLHTKEEIGPEDLDDEQGIDTDEVQLATDTSKLAASLTITLAVPSSAGTGLEGGPPQPTVAGSAGSQLAPGQNAASGTPSGTEGGSSPGHQPGFEGQSQSHGNSDNGQNPNPRATAPQAANGAQLPDPAFPFRSQAEAPARSESSSVTPLESAKNTPPTATEGSPKLAPSLPDALQKAMADKIAGKEASPQRETSQADQKQSDQSTQGKPSSLTAGGATESKSRSLNRLNDLAQTLSNSAGAKLEQLILGHPTAATSSASILMPALSPAIQASIIPDSAIAGRTMSSLSPQIAAQAVEHVAVQISKAVSAGKSTITVRMDPPELGRLDIRLEFSNDGALRAHVSADSRETLDLLSRDSKGLERALQDAGVKADSGNLQFSLRQNGEDLGQRESISDDNSDGQRPGEQNGLAEGEAQQEEIILSAYVPDSTGALDIRV